MAESDGQVIFDVRARLDKLEADMESAQSTVQKSGNAMSGIAKGAAAAIGAAFVSAGAAVVKFGTEFETAMAGASTLIDTSVTDMDALNGKLLELSDSTGIAANELGNSLYNAISAGVPATEDMSEAIGFLEENSKLAKAGFTDIDTAVTTTAKVLNAYGKDISETADVHKVLMQVQNQGIVTVGELGACLANVTPTAAALGVSFEDVGAALATMTAAGTPAAQATTQLNALFNEMGQTGSKADIALRNMTATVQAASEEQLDAMKSAFNDEYEAASESYSAQAKAYKKSLEEKEDEVEDYYDAQTDMLEKALDDEMETFENAHDQKLKLIDEEYTKKLKLIDEERYNAIKAVEDEINSINAKTKKEDKAIKDAENNQKRKALKEKINNAETAEDRKKAEEELKEFEDKLAREKLIAEREAEIESLKKKKEDIKEEYDKKKETLKEETNAKKEAVNEEYAAEKKALQEKQKLRKSALADEKAEALANIREINDADYEAFQNTNRKKLEALKEYQAEQLKAAAAGSGDGKGFSELLAEGNTYADIVRMLDEYAQGQGLTVSDMFGSSEAGKAALAVTGENAEKWDSNRAAMETDADVVGEAYDKVTNTVEDKFNRVLNTLKNSAIEVFNSIKEQIGELFSDENIEKLNKLIAPLKELIQKVLPPLLDIVLSLIDPVANLAEQLLPAIEVVITAVADVFSMLAPPLTEIINTVLPVLAEVLTAILKPATKIIEALMPPLLKLLDALLDPILQLIDALLPPLVSILDVIAPLLESLTPILGVISDVLGTRLSNAIQIVMPFIELFANNISALITCLQGLLDFVVNVFTGQWDKAWAALANNIKVIFSTIPKTLETIFNTVIGIINSIIDSINGVTDMIGWNALERWDEVDFTPDDDEPVPGYAFGSDYIPKDNFPARLHRGEAVLNAADAEVFRSLGGRGSLERMAAVPSSDISSDLARFMELASQQKGDTNITQNNYSPKALDPYEMRKYVQELEQTIGGE